mgnify:FL=1
MSEFTRRSVLAGSAIAAAGAAGMATAGAQEAGGAASVSVEEALRLRRSTRRFHADDLPEEQVLRLLWAANGVNRPDDDGRTVPSWRGAKHVDIYVAWEKGVHLYQPAANALEDVLGEDIRDRVTTASFAARAPLILLYVSDTQRLIEAVGEEGAGDEQALAIGAHVNSAIIAQNVYIFAAAEGLGTVLLSSAADREGIAAALSLSDDKVVTYIQPVGRPR